MIDAVRSGGIDLMSTPIVSAIIFRLMAGRGPDSLVVGEKTSDPVSSELQATATIPA
jgi:hypothetical protein